jgi:hypothetical protein
MAAEFLIRTATVADVPALNELIEASVRQLQKNDYTPEQIDGAVGHTLSLDTQLIADQTYFIAEATNGQPRLAGCGGWSNRKTLCGGDGAVNREMSQRFAPSTSIPRGRVVASGASSSSTVKLSRSAPDFAISRWDPR